MSKDAGHDETEKVLKEIEKRISREYKQAEKEVAAKLDDYLKKFETKDKTWQKWVADGTKTQKEYDQWRVGQICMGQRWDEQRKTLAQDFAKSSQIAKNITASKMPDVYAINHNYATFQIEQASMINTSYTLYDHKTVERLAKGDDKIIPVPGKKISRLIDEGKAVRWNERQIQSVMMQSLLQGESIPDIASRLAFSVGDSDRKASIRNARTLTTGVQNAGRVDSYERANEMGIQTAKQWIAALDDRTRHWHAELDGEIVENDEPFENEYGKIMYPGDPLADPANIYNCRCTLVAAIKGFDKDLSDRYDEKLGKMSYSQWKASKKSSSEDIEKQEKYSAKIKSKYIEEYSGGYKGVDIESSNNYDKNIEKRGQIDTGYKGRISDADKDKYNEQALNQIIKDTGYSKEEAKNFQDALIQYFGGDYQTIETDANSAITKTIISGLDKLPAYDGTITRGILLSNDDVKKFTSLKPGDALPTKGVLESWTSNENCAKSYASIGKSVDRSSVIFECRDNTKGKGVQHISMFNDVEAEVTVANPNYEVVEVITESKYDYLSRNRNELYFGDDLIEEERNLKEAMVCRVIVKEKR